MATEKIFLHPQYICERELLDKLERFTDGKKNKVEKFLWPYLTEESEDGRDKDAARIFANRKKRLYYVNNCEPFLWIHLAHMAQKISITGWTGETFKLINSDVTGEGVTQEQFAQDTLWYYMRDGRVGILVDRPPSPALNLYQARRLKERSYQIRYEAKDIVYWEKFDQDSPYRGLYRVVVLRDGDYLKDGKVYASFRRYFIEEGAQFYTYQKLRSQAEADKCFINSSVATQFEEEMEIITSFPINLPVIPFCMMGDAVDESFLYSIIENNEAHMNLTSCTSNVIYNQCFQRIIAFGVKSEELKRMGEFLVSTVDNPEGSVSTIEAGNPEAAFKEKSELNNNIFRRGMVQFNQLADDTRQVQSAPSKELDTKARQQLYDQTLDILSRRLETIWFFHALFEGQANTEVTVSIERDYGLEDPTAKETERSSAFTKAQILGAKEVQKQILKTSLPQLELIPNEGETEEDMMKRLNEDIDSSGIPQLPGDPRAGGAVPPGRGAGPAITKAGEGNGAAAQ